jgi:ABC-type Fe3+-siderophore transport system permease subunit
MKRLIKQFITGLTILLATLVPLTPALAGATAGGIFADTLKQDACSGLSQLDDPGSDVQGCSANGAGLNGTVKSVVNILSYFVGVAAVIMIIVAGLKFVTANGDSARVASARNTLTYALIGIAIAALAQVLINFVLSATNKK